jgi:hypothetical protein
MHQLLPIMQMMHNWSRGEISRKTAGMGRITSPAASRGQRDKNSDYANSFSDKHLQQVFGAVESNLVAYPTPGEGVKITRAENPRRIELFENTMH